MKTTLLKYIYYVHLQPTTPWILANFFFISHALELYLLVASLTVVKKSSSLTETAL